MSSPSLNNPKNKKGKRKYHQGVYRLKNIEKYIGDPSDIKYRSSWEHKFCIYCDNNPLIEKWCSEIELKYKMPHFDEGGARTLKEHRYYIDFYVETTNGQRKLVEIKPYAECIMPKKPIRYTAKSLETYEYSLKMYHKNLYKWNEAVKYASDREMEFLILTEKNINML